MILLFHYRADGRGEKVDDKLPDVQLDYQRAKDQVKAMDSEALLFLDRKKDDSCITRILEGKLFVEFVALIYLSYIQKKMEEKGLFAAYTLHELLEKLDVIECFMEPGKAPIQGEVLKKQEQIYRNLDVTPLLAAGQPADS